MSAYAKLRRKRQLFVDAYVRLGVKSEAAVAAGYSDKGAAVAGFRLMANAEVAAAVAEREQEAIERAGVRKVRVLEEMASLALASLEGLRDADGNVRKLKDIPAQFLRSAEAITFNEDGSVKSVKLAKTAGLNMLGKYLKILMDVVEHQGKDGGPIETHEVSDLEKARRIAHLLAQGLRAQPPVTVLTASDDDSISESGA